MRALWARQGKRDIILGYFLKTGLIVSLLFFIIGESKGQSLVINEMMSSNNSLVLDEDGDDSDWIEVYNTTNDDINLLGYFVSDDINNTQRWAFPDTIIHAKQFLLVFASGKNRAIAGKELHTNFSIKASGEPLLISHAGAVVHRMPPISLEPNMSLGLEPDGSAPFVVFYNPTPGASNNQAPLAARISFSKAGGIYQNEFALSIYCDSGQASVYYTTDGTSPTANSLLYTQPLQLCNELCSGANISQVPIYPPESFSPPAPARVPKAVVIRAAAFDHNGNQISDVMSNTYFIRDLGVDHHQLPILSICAEHDDLFGFESGIFVPGKHWNPDKPEWSGNYYQRGRNWEKEINLEYYEQDNVAINQKAGLRTHGGNSRRFSQKGMKLYARDDYGTSYFEHPFFEDKPIDRYKRLVLKPFCASWGQAGLEDYVTLKMAKNLNIDVLATKPVIVYLNGEYWGIYFIQERIDTWYIEANHGVDPDKVDLMGNWSGMIEYGNNKDFLALYNFIENNDLSISHFYETVSNWMDIDNFIDYQLLEIFIANTDWPANNMKCWRERDSDGKWRWIYYDGDASLRKLNFDSFLQSVDTTGQVFGANPTATLFLRKLLENDAFKNDFLKRLQELLDNQFSYPQTSLIYQKGIDDIINELPSQISRFSFPVDYDKWEEKVLHLKDFLIKRKYVIADHAWENFNVSITVDTGEVEKTEVKDLKVYPNPNNGNFTLNFHAFESAPANIVIYNHLGQVIDSFNQVVTVGENTVKYNLNDLPNGLLLISVVTEKQIYGARMIKREH